MDMEDDMVSILSQGFHYCLVGGNCMLLGHQFSLYLVLNGTPALIFFRFTVQLHSIPEDYNQMFYGRSG